MESLATSDALPRFALGDVIAGKYRVERVLGEGGMGVVVAARHEELGQRVAIKVLRPEISGIEGALERFLREARAAARLESDHVARVFDVGKLGSDCAFMVMEHLEGADLEQLLAERGRLEVEEAVDHVLEALEAVAHAHASGMVHRDLKPSNLFLAEKADGTRRVKVLDFGISKAEDAMGTSAKSSTLTSPNALLGSPAYMAPEQIRSSKSVDQRADIWSLGVILYELSTGVSPFVGDTVGDTFARVIGGEVTPLRSIRPEIPQRFAEVVGRCLEVDRERRFSDVAELARALAPLGSAPKAGELAARIERILGRDAAREHRISILSSPDARDVSAAAETIAATGSGTTRVGDSTISAWSGQESSPRKSRRAIFGLGAALAVAGVVALVLVSRTAPPAPPTSAGDASPPASPPAAAMTTIADKPEIAPVVAPVAAPEASASAAPEASAPATAASAQPSSVAKGSAPPKAPAQAGEAKTPSAPKATSAPKGKPAYPKNLLDGRD